jgi:hypothetical protein
MIGRSQEVLLYLLSESMFFHHYFGILRVYLINIMFLLLFNLSLCNGINVRAVRCDLN